MNMLRYAEKKPEFVRIRVPTIHSPTRFFLREILLDSAMHQLIVCTARCPNKDDWPIEMYDLYTQIDDLERKPVLKLEDLSNSLVYACRDSSQNLVVPHIAPTIEIGIFDNRTLNAGELFYDPYAKILFLGAFVNGTAQRHCIKCA